MEETTKTVPKWLWWAVGIAGALCVGIAVLAAVLLLNRQTPQPEATTVPALTEPEITAVPDPTESIQSLLDIPQAVYDPQDFSYGEDGYMHYAGAPYRIGVDVSSWQRQVDWQQVKAAGMEFAMIRFAWRGNTEGGIREDDRARENYQGAKEAGLLVGGYFFSQAVTPEEAVEEAEFLLEMIGDWEIDMPIVYDWERSANRTAEVDGHTVTACALAFCRTVEEAGYTPMIYFNIRQAYSEICLEDLTQYDFWLAQYNDCISFPYEVHMWQYTSTGDVPGVPTNVDINLQFLPEEE